MPSFSDLLHWDLGPLTDALSASARRSGGLEQYSSTVKGAPAFRSWTGTASDQARALAGAHSGQSDRIAEQAKALLAPLSDYATRGCALKAQAQELAARAAAHGYHVEDDGSVAATAPQSGLYAKTIAGQLAGQAAQLLNEDTKLHQDFANAIHAVLGDDMAALAEKKAGAPTPNPGYPNPDLAIDGKAVDALSFTEANLYGPNGDPSPDDIFQKGGIGQGDCWFASAMGAVALQQPDVIKNDISYDPATKSYNVTLYNVPQDFASPSDTTAPASSKRTINISQDELKYDIAQAGASGVVYSKPDGSFGVNPKASVWPAVMEAAYGKMRYGSVQAGVGEFYHGGIAGGTPDAGLKSITGHSGVEVSARSLTYDQLSKALANHQPVELGTTGTDGNEAECQDGLAHNHAYTVTGVSRAANGDVMVTARNPWGVNYLYDPQSPHSYTPVTGDNDPRNAYVTFDLNQINKDDVVDSFQLGDAPRLP